MEVCVTSKTSDPLNIPVNTDINAVSECFSCTSVALKKVRVDAYEDYRNSNVSKVKLQTVNNHIDEKVAVVEKFQHKGKDSMESNTRIKNDLINELHIPVIVNAEVVMEKEGEDIYRMGSLCSKVFENKNSNGEIKAKKHKIVLLGDSHNRGNIKSISHHLESDFDLFGLIKPGTSIIDIVPQTTVKYRHLTKKGAILIQAGSIDVYKNNSKTALMQIKRFCENLSNPNIILLNITHRWKRNSNL
jgi:hypothetical protein